MVAEAERCCNHISRLGVGFCCMEGPGDFVVKTIFDVVIVSDTGKFTDSMSVPFPVTLSDASYRFVGKGESGSGSVIDWYNPAN